MAGNENLINGINVVLQIEEAFDKVDQTVKRLKTTLTGLERSLRLPSEVINQATQLAENLRQNAEAQQNLNNVNNQAQAIRQRARQSTAEEIANNRILARNANQSALSNSALAGAYGRLSAQQAIASRRLQDLIARGRTAEQTQRQYNAELRRAQGDFDRLNQRVLSADRAVGRFNRNVGNYPDRALRGIRDLIGAFGIVGGVTLFAQLSKDIFNTTREIQGLDLALKQVSKSNEGFVESQAFLLRISEAYGIEINGLTRSYTGFLAASQNAIDAGKITADQIQDIFESVSKASGAMGLSVEQQQGAFLALQQMISKGNVQAEEIRGQLAERLPGAFGILSRSMGVTEEQLNKLLKDGKVLAAEVLPAFARELEKAYGVDKIQRVESLAASTTRLGNAWTNFIRDIDEGDSKLNKFFSTIVDGAGVALKALGDLFKSQDKYLKDEKSDEFNRGYANAAESIKKSAAETSANLKQSASESEETLKGWALALKNRVTPEIETLNKKLEEAQGLKKLGEDASWLERQFSKKLFDALNKGTEDVETYTKRLGYANGELEAANKILNQQNKKPVVDLGGGKTKRQKADIDFLKEVYQLRKQNADNTIADEQRIMNDEEVNYSKRLDAANNYYFQRKHLIELETQEQLRLNELERKNQTETYSKAISEGQATYSNLQEIEYKYIINKKRIEEKAEYDRNQLIIEERKKLRNVLNEIEGLEKRNDISTDELQRYYEYYAQLDKVTVNTSYKTFEELEKRRQKIQDKYGERRNKLALEEVNAKIEALKLEQNITYEESDAAQKNLALNKLIQERNTLQKEGLDIQLAQKEEAKQLSLELKRTTDQYLQGFSNGFLQDAGLDIFTDIFQKGEDGLTNFQRRMKGAGEDLTKQFQVSFTTITELAQQAFAFINQASQTRFRLEYEGLERQKDSQLRFAGESQAAQEEITRQYEEKRRDIRNRELRAQKDQATFNAIINTAQAVVAALPNIPLSVTIGAIGAAQIAFIRAQQIPAFAEGGITEKNGQILVNDAGGSNYKEVVMTPSGKVFMPQKRNTIMNMPKGTEIFKDYSTFDKRLNEMLMANNIAPGYNYSLPVLPSVQQSGSGNISAAIKNGFAGLKQSIVNISMDKRGWNMSIENGHNEQELRNNSLRCNGRRIR